MHRLIISLLLLGNIMACENKEIKKESTLPLDEKIVIWVEERAQLIVKHRADCNQMAQALRDHHLDHQELEKKWKDIRKQMDIDQKMLFDQLYGSRLKTAMEKSRILYEYCSEDESIRNLDKIIR